MGKSQGSRALVIIIVVLLLALAVTEYRRRCAVADFSMFAAQLTGADTIEFANDGDTLTLKQLGKVRLLGVSVPETWVKDKDGKWHRIENPDPRAIKAHEYTRSLEGKKVRVQLGKQKVDKYDRKLVHLYVLPDGPDIATYILRKGWGEVQAIPPNTRRLSDWKNARSTSENTTDTR